MRRQPNNIHGESYQDQTIDPLRLFKIPDQKNLKSRKTEKLPQKFTPPTNLALKIHYKTENLLSQRYRSLTQRSETDQQLHEDQLPFRKKNRISSANLPNVNQQKDQNPIWKATLSKRHKDRRPQLREIVRRHKISNIVKNFMIKLKRNNPFSQAVELQQHQEGQSLKWLNFSGIQLGQQLQRALDIIFLVINFLGIYFYTLGLAFDIHGLAWAETFENCLLIAYIIEFLLGCLANKCISGKWITKFKQIVKCYLAQSMLIDLWMIVMLAIETAGNGEAEYLNLVLVLKLPHLLQKMQKLEIHCIATSYREQYWSLAKLFLFNFCFAHLLALTLRFMANISPHQNWITAKAISNSPWYQTYIWSYYWSINIMLTVGFGDIVATNYQQAMCLIFIETFSCMVLAYNISSVGALISNIRGQDLQKSRKYRIFRGLADKHGISSQLSLRIGNYIEQSNNIKKKFNIEDENKFLDTLPRIFKKDYLKEANKRIFNHIFFFSNLAQRAVQALAEVIQVSITHPEELIINPDNYMALKILKQGRMGYCCRKLGSTYNGRVIDQISVAEGQAPVLLGVEFITHRRPIFEIKSMQYSIIYGLTYDRLIQSLRKSRGDYEYLCFLRDKTKCQIDQFQINRCPYCTTKHTRFLCPKLHFIPIRQQVVNRSLHTERISKCHRQDMERSQYRGFHPLRHYHTVNELPFGGQLSTSTMHKNKGYFVNQLMKDVKRINTELSHQGTILNNFPMIFLNNTAQSIKQELSSFLRRENEEDEVWDIALDCMQNYKNYFPQDNAGELSGKLINGANTMSSILGSKLIKNPFIVYNQREKTLREGTYVYRMASALQTQTFNNTQTLGSDYLSTLEQL